MLMDPQSDLKRPVWPTGNDPAAHEALLQCLLDSDVEVIAERIETLEKSLHDIKTPLAKLRLRLELALRSNEEAFKAAEDELLPDEVVRPLAKGVSELVLLMDQFGWSLKPEGNAIRGA